MAPASKCFPRSSDKILSYSKTQQNYIFNSLYESREAPIKQLVRKFVNGRAINARDENGNVIKEGLSHIGAEITMDEVEEEIVLFEKKS